MSKLPLLRELFRVPYNANQITDTYGCNPNKNDLATER